VVIPNDGRFDNQNGPINGRNCVAVLSPDTPVRNGGGQSLVEGSLEEGQYACHPFTISKREQPKDQCSEGFVMNSAGRCVCPEGTTFRNGRCTADQGATPTPTPKPRWPPPRQCRTAARPDPDAGRPVRVPARHQAAERALPPGRGRMPEADKAGARSMRDHPA
jgi:hypothetical protein